MLLCCERETHSLKQSNLDPLTPGTTALSSAWTVSENYMYDVFRVDPASIPSDRDMPLVFPLPPLSTRAAHIIAAFFAVSYVGSLYISKNARISFAPKAGTRKAWSRDDPDVIKARMLAVSLSTVGSCVAVFLLVWHIVGDHHGSVHVALETTAARLGLTIFNDHSIYPYLVTPMLYLGPLYATYLYKKLPLQAEWSLKGDLYPAFFTWVGIRNYVFGPLTEEVVFRACVLAVYHLAGSSTNKMVFLSPLSFGLAHLHHALDTYNKSKRDSGALRLVLMVTLFQLAYTTLFGFHCAFLFLRTGSIYPPLISHVFCNFMGLPQLPHEIRDFPLKKKSLIVVYLVGVVGYVYGMRNWTLAEDSLYWPDAIQRY